MKRGRGERGIPITLSAPLLTKSDLNETGDMQLISIPKKKRRKRNKTQEKSE